MKKNTLHINLFAGPGTGKSTTAAAVFAELKYRGENCELINEYAKGVVWEESFKKLENQIYLFGKQHKYHYILNGKVDYIITDSPLPLGCIYDDNNTKYLKELILSEFNKFNNLNIFLKRKKAYNPIGRTQTESEAINIDEKVLEFLRTNNIPYIILDSDRDVVKKIVEEIYPF